MVFYSLPAALAKQVRSLMWTLTHAFMPLFSDLHARGRGDHALQVYMTATRLVVAVMAPVVVIIVMLGANFIGRWIGPSYGERGATVLPFVVCAFLLPLLSPFASRYLTAIGQHGFLAKAAAISAAASITFSLALVRPFGIEGVAAAIVVPPIVLTLTVTAYVCRHLGISVGQYYWRTLVPILLPLLLMTVVAWEVKKWLGTAGYFQMACIAGAAGLVYLLTVPWFAVRGSERGAVMAWFGTLSSRLRGRHA